MRPLNVTSFSPQYEKAFSPKYLQNWSPAKPTKEVLHVLLRSQYLILPTISVTHWHLISLASSKFPYPSLPQHLAQIPWTPILSFLFHFSQALLSSPPPQRISSQEGYTQIIANDRGHLLPSVPRSKESPWGSFMGTWQMPLKVPPARVTLTSRSVAGAASLTKWIQKNPDLLKASNGLRPEIFGKPHDPDGQRKLGKSLTKTVQQAPSPIIIPSSPAANLNSPDQPQSSHPSAGHTPGPQSPVSSLKTPPGCPCTPEHWANPSSAEVQRYKLGAPEAPQDHTEKKLSRD
uniref:Protein Flattop n=1 Tax=Canis lupus familiaris TaxID=9615 RepID=A0A8C0P0L8_CANLF